MGHHWVPIRQLGRSYALLSDSDSKNTAIVFVHGFGGDPQTTWLQFQILIDTMSEQFPLFATCDLFFFAYDSFRKTPQDVAVACLEFIGRIFPKPRTDTFQTSPVTYPPQVSQIAGNAALSLVPDSYARLVLVGHSEGALVLRIAIWNALKDVLSHFVPDPSPSGAAMLEQQPILSADLCLFSPAHLGSNLPDWLAHILAALLGVPSAGRALLASLGIATPAALYLQPEGVVVVDTRRFTEEFSEKYPNVASLRARMLWGSLDKMVVLWQYKWDYPVEYVGNKGHGDVCKPNPTYLKPLHFVISHEQRKKTAGT